MPDRRAEPGPTRPAAPRELPPGAAAAADDLVRAYQHGEGQPGIAYGIVAGRDPGPRGWRGRTLARRATARRGHGVPHRLHDQELLGLGAAGAARRRRLRLDDPVTDFVPELARLAGRTADSPPISLRHLLTMTAGFPTDDPWGDRQQGTPLPEFGGNPGPGGAGGVGPGHPFRVLQPGLRPARSGHLGRGRGCLPGRGAGRAARPARHEPHRVRGGGVQPGRAGPGVRPRRGWLDRAHPGSAWGVRADGRRVQQCPGSGPLGGRLCRGLPAGQPAGQAMPTRCRRPRAARCSSPR